MCGFVAARRSGDLAGVLRDALRRVGCHRCTAAGLALVGPDRVVRVDPVAPGPGSGPVGIGTTGGPGDRRPDPYPRTDCTSRVVVAFEGDLENATELTAALRARGHGPAADDGEVVAHLVEEELALGWNLTAAVRISSGRLRGSWAVAAAAVGEQHLVLTAHHVPLVVGSAVGGPVAATDLLAVAGCDTASFLHDGDLVEFRDDHADGIRWTDHRDRPVRRPRTPPTGHPVVHPSVHPAVDPAATADRQIGAWFPAVRAGTVWERLALPVPRRVRVVASPSARTAAEVTARVLRRFGGVDCGVHSDSWEEFGATGAGATTVAFSTSGESADVLHALDVTSGPRGRGPLLAVTGAPASSLARRADAVLDLGGHGPGEDPLVAQVLAGVFLGVSAAVTRDRWPRAVLVPVLEDLLAVPGSLLRADDVTAGACRDVVPRLAAHLRNRPGVLVVGRGAALPYAVRAALDLTGTAGTWAQAHPSGELGRGPLALVGPGTPVLVVEDGAPAPDPVVHQLSARGADVLRIGPDGSTFPVLRGGPHPWGPLESVVALRRLAASLAGALAAGTTPAPAPELAPV